MYLYEWRESFAQREAKYDSIIKGILKFLEEGVTYYAYNLSGKQVPIGNIIGIRGRQMLDLIIQSECGDLENEWHPVWIIIKNGRDEVLFRGWYNKHDNASFNITFIKPGYWCNLVLNYLYDVPWDIEARNDL